MRRKAAWAGGAGLLAAACALAPALIRADVPGLARENWHWTHPVAGGARGYEDGIARASRFDAPQGLAIDAAGTLYVTDTYNHRIRRVTADGQVTTVAGGGRSGFEGGGFADGVGEQALFRFPRAIAIDARGDLYVADTNNNAVRKIAMSDPAHPRVTTLAGGQRGCADGRGASTRFWDPWGLAVAPDGTVYVADTYNNRIRQISPGGRVTTLAGGGRTGPAGGGYVDAAGARARFFRPVGIAWAGGGRLLVADAGNRSIRTVSRAGQVGSFSTSVKKLDADGIPPDVGLVYPAAIAGDGHGRWFVVDAGLNRVLALGADGVPRPYAGTDEGLFDAVGPFARFKRPSGLAIDGAGHLVVSDTGNHCLRRIDGPGEGAWRAGAHKI